MTRPRGFAHARLGRRGIAALEFALLAPVMLFVAAGVVETGMLLRAYDAVNRLAAQYAVSYADCPDLPAGSCQTELAQYKAAATIGNIAPQLTSANVTLQMEQVKMAGNVPNLTYTTGGSLSAAQISAAQAIGAASGSEIIIVSVSYPYTLMFFQNLMATFYGPSVAMSYTVAQLKASSGP